MAGEIRFAYLHGATCYFLVWNTRTGQIWNNSSTAFEAYSTANYANYALSMTEAGTASHSFVGNFPTSVPAGTYGLEGRQQLTGSVAETDPTVAEGNLEWAGSQAAALSDTVTSGQLSQIAPIRLARGVQVANFPFKLVSNIDHVTPFTSGICSGQISRDGGAFTALQSGVFSELGLGWYFVQALTSGDLLCNTAAFAITAVGISGGASDQRDFGFILQKVSGSV